MPTGCAIGSQRPIIDDVSMFLMVPRSGVLLHLGMRLGTEQDRGRGQRHVIDPVATSATDVSDSCQRPLARVVRNVERRNDSRVVITSSAAAGSP